MGNGIASYRQAGSQTHTTEKERKEEAEDLPPLRHPDLECPRPGISYESARVCSPWIDSRWRRRPRRLGSPWRRRGSSLPLVSQRSVGEGERCHSEVRRVRFTATSVQLSSVQLEVSFSVAVENSPHRNRLLSGCSAAGGERGKGRGADCLVLAGKLFRAPVLEQ
jgi:hypothetical protein